MIGEMIGMVTLVKRRQALAPSISAASCNSLGTPCRPARKMIIWKPVSHRLMMMRAGLAQPGSNSQLTGPSPNQCNTSLSTPNSGLRIWTQTTAKATAGVMEGR